jgi:hypothetical protein
MLYMDEVLTILYVGITHINIRVFEKPVRIYLGSNCVIGFGAYDLLHLCVNEVVEAVRVLTQQSSHFQKVW